MPNPLAQHWQFQMTLNQDKEEPGNRQPGSLVFLTGATGYIGGRLAPRLVEKGYGVRCLVRSSTKLHGRPWASKFGVEVVEGDVGDKVGLEQAMQGCTSAYYLVHSMHV